MSVEEGPFEDRHAESQRVLIKFPDRVPVILKMAGTGDAPSQEFGRFLAPNTMTWGAFRCRVHKQINQELKPAGLPEKTVYVLVKGNLPKTATTMGVVYEQCKDDDGMLYATCSEEDTFGA
mmetsp:Transcript_36305/g.104498  ORF Transcript_36305/g.104498 Transcript_36305/m.104498 type:complete len:121 (-) Transcript_36305:163-525(-)